jgi:hypothetical protein
LARVPLFDAFDKRLKVNVIVYSHGLTPCIA